MSYLDPTPPEKPGCLGQELPSESLRLPLMSIRALKKLVLRNHQSPGDIMMLTAAVRDLHRAHPGFYLTDVRTSCPELWANNPYLTPIADTDPEALFLDCEYPLVHRSNEVRVHFLHGFIEFLNERLGLGIQPTELRGDLHLSAAERDGISPIRKLTGAGMPYWVVAAGGKYDFTIKWWESRRYQRVVDHFRGTLAFVQIGESGHFHPPLNHVIDLRGQTSLRELVGLVFHADGVVCPVTFLMHLVAALPPRVPGRPRSAIVIAGGREPVHWEAYPDHDFLHTIGRLPCCLEGGCWRSRAVPLHDGEIHDQSLCSDLADSLPRCMDLISPEQVIDVIERKLAAGRAKTLRPEESILLAEHWRRDEREEFGLIGNRAAEPP